MSDFSHSLSASASALRAQANRLRHVSENISNADTPGYRRKTVPFETIQENGRDMVQAGRVKLDRRDLSRIYDPSHPMADDTGHYLGSNVDLMIEIADAREAQRSYVANLTMFHQTRQIPCTITPMINPITRFSKVISNPATASPLTNLEAPSNEPKKVVSCCSRSRLSLAC